MSHKFARIPQKRILRALRRPYVAFSVYCYLCLVAENVTQLAYPTRAQIENGIGWEMDDRTFAGAIEALIRAGMIEFVPAGHASLPPHIHRDAYRILDPLAKPAAVFTMSAAILAHPDQSANAKILHCFGPNRPDDWRARDFANALGLHIRRVEAAFEELLAAGAMTTQPRRKGGSRNCQKSSVRKFMEPPAINRAPTTIASATIVTQAPKQSAPTPAVVASTRAVPPNPGRPNTLPDDFALDATDKKVARNCNLDAESVLAEFRPYWRGEGKKKMDWHAAFQARCH